MGGKINPWTTRATFLSQDPSNVFFNESASLAEHGRNWVLHYLGHIKGLLQALSTVGYQAKHQDTLRKFLTLSILENIPASKGKVSGSKNNRNSQTYPFFGVTCWNFGCADGGSIAKLGIELLPIERCFIKGTGTVFCYHADFDATDSACSRSTFNSDALLVRAPVRTKPAAALRWVTTP